MSSIIDTRYYGSQTRVDFQKLIVESQIWMTCLNCAFWGPNVALLHPEKNLKSTDHYCCKWAARPPLDVIVSACSGWEGYIPF